MYFLAIIVGRLTRFAIRLVRPGGGSALPGVILSKLAPGILKRTLGSFPQGVFIVTGSAGKSTTTKMLVAIARAHGLRVFTNPSTANITQGFYATIIERSSLSGRITGDIAILEMDEGHAATLVDLVPPRFVTVLNVMEDQLDRFVDPALVREKLAKTAAAASDGVVLNADDQNLLLIADDVPAVKSWVGIDDVLMAQQAHGLGYAPTYLEQRVKPEVSALVLRLNGLTATIRRGDVMGEVKLPNRGLHFALDAVAAIESAALLFGDEFDFALSCQTLSELPPVFARGEIAEVEGQQVEFILVQNPMSFQLNLDYLTTEPERLMVAIGRDVHDPSWLWTVDLSNISQVDVVTGYNAYEMALRFAYDEVPMGLVEPDLESAVRAFLDLPAPTRGVKTVIFSADAMRRIRRMLGFTNPEDVSR